MIVNTVRRKKEAAKGGRLVLGKTTTIQPLTRKCFNCSPEEGNELPIEMFTRAPCCGHKMCYDCKRQERARGEEMCGECWTPFPPGENRATIWIRNLMNSGDNFGQRAFRFYLLGRIYIHGQCSYVDEIECVPMYEPLSPDATNSLLSIMLSPDIEQGIGYLTIAAELEFVPAMLYLADVYSEYFSSSPGSHDKKKAEYWYTRALGKGSTIHPLAFTRYGLFLIREGRFKEARAIFQVAAEYGHARGQFEYAKCLLNGTERERLWLFHCITNIVSNDDHKQDIKMEAIQWLCKASQNGHYFPSYILLAKVIIEIAEKNNAGRADCVGRSPIPRAFQTLELAKSDRGVFRRRSINDREKTLKEIEDIFDQYEFTSTQCANCGQPDTEVNPLFACHTCRVVRYCSKLCQKKHYRDGHRIDCCSQRSLFRFDLIEKSLRYQANDISGNEVKGDAIGGEYDGENNANKTLSRLVDDVTDEVYFGEDEDYDSERLAQLMLKMRRNLEKYIAQFVDVTHAANRKIPLTQRIKSLVNEKDVPTELVSAMEMIRQFGNEAAHQMETNSAQLDHDKCKEAVLAFLTHKKTFDEKMLEQSYNSNGTEKLYDSPATTAPTSMATPPTETTSAGHPEDTIEDRADLMPDTDIIVENAESLR